jgi:transglutaminase-like putative cysteine protease
VAIHVALNHVSVYRYDRWVGLSPQVVRLRPAPHCRTPILSYSLRITPEHHFVNWQQDPQGNYLARVVFPDKVRELRVEVDLVAELAVYNPFDFFLEPHAEQFPFVYSDEQARELFPYLRMEPLSPRFTGYLGAVSRQPRPTLDFLVELNQRVQRDVAYVIRYEAGVQSKEETLALGRGSCRDSAWLLVQLLRHLGLAARFVSGYLIQLVPDVKRDPDYVMALPGVSSELAVPLRLGRMTVGVLNIESERALPDQAARAIRPFAFRTRALATFFSRHPEVTIADDCFSIIERAHFMKPKRYFAAKGSIRQLGW